MAHSVAYVIPTLNTGGAELQTINQLNFLWEHSRENFYCIVLSAQVDNMDLLKMPAERIIVLNGKETTVTTRGIKEAFTVSKMLATVLEEHDIKSVLAILPYAHLCSRLAKRRLSRKKRFFHAAYYRDVYYDASPMDTVFKKVFNKFHSYIASRNDDASVFISRCVYKNIADHFFTTNPLVIPNSLPYREVGPEAGLEYLSANGIDLKNKFSILLPGRLHRKKGHEFFIRALGKFMKEEKLSPERIHVIFAGDGPDREQVLKAISESGLAAMITVTGWVPNHVLLSLYKCVSLVVIPSIFEGFGNVCIEGLMQQASMLVADTGGLGEIIRQGENGYKFKVLDEDDLIRQLSALYHGQLPLPDKEALLRDFFDKYTIESQMAALDKHCFSRQLKN